LKARRGVAVAAGLRAQELERHALADGRVGRLEDGTHAASPDQAIDVVLAGDGGADEQVELISRLVPTIE